MKNLHFWSFSIGSLVAGIVSNPVFAQTSQTLPETAPAPQMESNTPIYNDSQAASTQNLRAGIVNTKKCLEESKLGKQEHANFERMKHQMESILQEKEKSLEEVETKLNDDDYMSGLSDEAALELNRKKRSIRNEGMQLQSQYMQTLQQANMKIVQRLTDVISRASAQVAQDTSSGQPIDIIFTDEACTYYNPRLDVSDRVIAKMNAIFDAEPQDNSTNPK